MSSKSVKASIKETVVKVKKERVTVLINCRKCGENKPLSDFNWQIDRRCKSCRAAYNREWRAAYKERWGKSYGT